MQTGCYGHDEVWWVEKGMKRDFQLKVLSWHITHGVIKYGTCSLFLLLLYMWNQINAARMAVQLVFHKKAEGAKLTHRSELSIHHPLHAVLQRQRKHSVLKQHRTFANADITSTWMKTATNCGYIVFFFCKCCKYIGTCLHAYSIFLQSLT